MPTKRKYAHKELANEFGELSFARVLKALRLSLNVSQAELAAKLGLKSRSYVADLEKGRQIPSPELAAETAKKLGMPQEHWMGLAIKDRLKGMGYDCKIKITKTA